MENSKRILKLKAFFEKTFDVEIMFHQERQEYFFEWVVDDMFINIWLNDIDK